MIGLSSIQKALFLTALLSASSLAQADVFVVVSKSSPIESLSEKELIAIYTGKTRAFPNGEFATAIDHKDDSPIKAEFYEKLTNRTVSQINRFWARLAFAGRYSPPTQIADENEIMEAVANAPSALAYVSEPNRDLVKVVYVIP